MTNSKKTSAFSPKNFKYFQLKVGYVVNLLLIKNRKKVFKNGKIKSKKLEVSLGFFRSMIAEPG
jgi:hypothetical protein